MLAINILSENTCFSFTLATRDAEWNRTADSFFKVSPKTILMSANYLNDKKNIFVTIFSSKIWSLPRKSPPTIVRIKLNETQFQRRRDKSWKEKKSWGLLVNRKKWKDAFLFQTTCDTFLATNSGKGIKKVWSGFRLKWKIQARIFFLFQQTRGQINVKQFLFQCNSVIKFILKRGFYNLK